MSLKLKYKDQHGIVHIDMTPASPRSELKNDPDITDPKFDTINNRFGQYDLFGGKYDGGDAPQSLFRSRYNSIEEELANTPYAFATERSLRLNTSNNIDITIKSDTSPSRDIEDDRFFKRNIDCDLFGPQIDLKDEAFTVTQLIHAQDRYYDLSSRQSNSSGEVNCFVPITRTKVGDDAFKVLNPVKAERVKTAAATIAAFSTTKSKREKSFAILTEPPVVSRPSSPRSLPSDIRHERVSPFKGRGFREETSRHNTPKTSASNSRSCSPPRRRTSSLSRIDKMAQAATLALPVQLNRSHSPRNFLKENIEEIRELSELNREKHEQQAERTRIEEEEALLIEMGLLDKKSIRSRSTSRSNSPSKINLRSRSNSPSAILHFENIPSNSKEFINVDDEIPKPVTHRSRLRSVSRSQPQSNDVSPKHSKIPKRQNSVSPTRTPKRELSSSRRLLENNLGKNQRFISSSTSSIHETIRIGSQVHDKRGMSKSNQNLDIAPNLIKGKPPISPGKSGPPPSNKAINSKRLSPIVGTPNKSPIDDLKLGSARSTVKPSPIPRKIAGSTPAVSRLNSRPTSRPASRDSSPDKRTTKSMGTKNNQTKPMNRTPITRTNQTPQMSNKSEIKKPVNRTNSIKSLTRTPSTKTLNEKPPLLKKTNSKRDLNDKTHSNNKLNEISVKKDIVKDNKKLLKSADKKKDTADIGNEKNEEAAKVDSVKVEEIKTQDNETQYDKMSNDKAELVIMTKKNVVSMTTAAITSQPLEVVTTVTNQLPAVLEKAREKAIFERLSSKDSLVGKEEEKNKQAAQEDLKEIKVEMVEIKEQTEENKEEQEEKEKNDDKKPAKPIKNNTEKTLFTEDHIKLRPLQPPYNNPQVERVKQRIDDIFKEPEISRENILTPSAKSRETTSTFKNIPEKTKTNVKNIKDDVSIKLTDIKEQAKKQNEKMVSEIRSEATKIIDSIITPVEQPKNVTVKITEVKKDIEPTVVVVNEKKNNIQTDAIHVTETLVKGDAEVEVQSSNVSTPIVNTMVVDKKMPDGNGSNKSMHSNGGFPQSTSTTPKPPVRTRKEPNKSPPNEETREPAETTPETKPPNICERIMGKCKSKCCPCCIKRTKDDDSEPNNSETDAKERRKGSKDDEVNPKGNNDTESEENKKKGIMDTINCFKRKKENEDKIREVEMAAGKASVEFENETKRKRKIRDLCGCCGSRRRVSDVSLPREELTLAPADAGCCGKRRSQPDRRDSILSDRSPTSCCNNRLCTWFRGMCRRHSDHSSSRRNSEFSKNKSLSPTLPPEDTRKKLDTTLVEHTSVMRGAIPVLPIVLAYFCLLCNIIVPGLGTILSGLFCLCFGIPRFGVHDGLKHRIGSFVINLLVGCGQLFTVLFCLVGWGWSVWWGVIFVKISRKYRKLKKETAIEEAESAPPVTTNNHARP